MPAPCEPSIPQGRIQLPGGFTHGSIYAAMISRVFEASFFLTSFLCGRSPVIGLRSRTRSQFSSPTGFFFFRARVFSPPKWVSFWFFPPLMEDAYSYQTFQFSPALLKRSLLIPAAFFLRTLPLGKVRIRPVSVSSLFTALLRLGLSVPAQHRFSFFIPSFPLASRWSTSPPVGFRCHGDRQISFQISSFVVFF